MLKHGAVTQFRIAMLKHKPLHLAVKANTVKSAIHMAETARELRC
jgi:hypothetical protein